jgi:hypothetical protein
MSSSIHTALHHRVTVPSWIVAALLALVFAIGALAVVAGSDDGPAVAPAQAAAPALVQARGTDVAAVDQQAPIAAPAYRTMPTSCVDASVVGHC